MPPAREPLKVAVQLEERDVVRAHFWTLFQLPLVRLLLGLNGLLLLFVLLLSIRSLVRSSASPVLAFGLFVVLLFFALFPFQVWRRARGHFRSLSAEERRGTYTFSDKGFEWTLGKSPGSMPWEALRKIGETDSYLFLMVVAWRTHVIPKRCLRQGERERVLELVKAAAGTKLSRD